MNDIIKCDLFNLEKQKIDITDERDIRNLNKIELYHGKVYIGVIIVTKTRYVNHNCELIFDLDNIYGTFKIEYNNYPLEYLARYLYKFNTRKDTCIFLAGKMDYSLDRYDMLIRYEEDQKCVCINIGSEIRIYPNIPIDTARFFQGIPPEN